jgi:hypothetical protein
MQREPQIQCWRLHDVRKKTYVIVRDFILCDLGRGPDRAGGRSGAGRFGKFWKCRARISLRAAHRKHWYSADWQHRATSDRQYYRAAHRLRSTGLESQQSK